MLPGISSEHPNSQETSDDLLSNDNLDADEHEKESKIAVQTECLSVFFNERPAIEDINLRIKKIATA